MILGYPEGICTCLSELEEVAVISENHLAVSVGSVNLLRHRRYIHSLISACIVYRLAETLRLEGEQAAVCIQRLGRAEGDRFVPPEMSEEIALANPDMVERHTFADAGHGLSYFYDTERYKSIVKDFLKKHP